MLALNAKLDEVSTGLKTIVHVNKSAFAFLGITESRDHSVISYRPLNWKHVLMARRFSCRNCACCFRL